VLSTRDLRTIDRVGLSVYAAQHGLDVSRL
jgi:hypothetical protein